MRLCRDLKHDVVERDITPFELLTAEEVFFSGTLVGVAAVVEVNGKAIGSGKLGPSPGRCTTSSGRWSPGRRKESPYSERRRQRPSGGASLPTRRTKMKN